MDFTQIRPGVRIILGVLAAANLLSMFFGGPSWWSLLCVGFAAFVLLPRRKRVKLIRPNYQHRFDQHAPSTHSWAKSEFTERAVGSPPPRRLFVHPPKVERSSPDPVTHLHDLLRERDSLVMRACVHRQSNLGFVPLSIIKKIEDVDRQIAKVKHQVVVVTR